MKRTTFVGFGDHDGDVLPEFVVVVKRSVVKETLCWFGVAFVVMVVALVWFALYVQTMSYTTGLW